MQQDNSNGNDNTLGQFPHLHQCVPHLKASYIGILDCGNLGDATHHSHIGNVDNVAKTAENRISVSRSLKQETK